MPKTYFSFDDAEPPKAKDVSETKQLEPRTGNAAFETGNNELIRNSRPHGNLGQLGDRSFGDKSK